MPLLKLVATPLLLVALIGCESPQKQVVRLQADYDKLDAQYKTDCDDPWSSTDPQQAARVLHGDSLSASDAAAFRAHEKERVDRIASPHCKEIDGKRKQLSTELLAAQNKAAGQN